ncbi:unnamed protein product [Haemonchus placei]|uniref:Uncharacterized protein n=1 Tax=Haemonchus placei TaxID=6290 RepID=A0A0N4X7W6_HAEPC|nr:unnamed protein product [Haemonchus placei]
MRGRSYNLSTAELLAVTDGVVDSDVDFGLGRTGWCSDSDTGGAAVFAVYATTSRLAPYRTRAKAMSQRGGGGRLNWPGHPPSRIPSPGTLGTSATAPYNAYFHISLTPTTDTKNVC